MSTLAPQELTAFEARAVQLFVDAAGVLGVPKSIAMIYGVLFGSAMPLSFGEIEQKLGISKGSVSQGLRVLRNMGAVETVTPGEEGGEPRKNDSPVPPTPGSRYQPVVELRLLLARILADRIQPHLTASAEAIDDLTGLLPADPAQTAILDTRLQHLRAWQKRAKDFLPVIKTFLKIAPR